MNPVWSKRLLGNNTDPKYNFENFACLLCCLASIANYYKRNVDPVALNEELKRIGGYPPGSGEYINGKLQELFPEIKERGVPTPAELTDAQMQEIKSSLDAGHPVVIGVDYNPKTIAFDSHFVILVDYDPNDENNFTIADPLGGRIHSLKDYLSTTVPTARKSIWKYFIFQGEFRSSVDPVEDRPHAVVATPGVPTPGSALPENYGAIIKQSGNWETIARKFFPNDAPENITPEMIDAKMKEHPYVRVETKEVEKIVEKVVQGDGSQNKNWEDLVLYLERDPHNTSFEDVKRVIAGYKSRETDFAGKAKEANDKVSKREAEIHNLTEQISILKAEVTSQAKLHKAQIDSLKKATPSFDALIRQYDTIIAELKKQYDPKVSELQQLRIDLAVKNGETIEIRSTGSTGSGILLPIGAIARGLRNWLSLKW